MPGLFLEKFKTRWIKCMTFNRNRNKLTIVLGLAANSTSQNAGQADIKKTFLPFAVDNFS